MELITHLKNGSTVRTKLSDKVKLAADGKHVLTSSELHKRISNTSKAIGGLEYDKHKIIF